MNWQWKLVGWLLAVGMTTYAIVWLLVVIGWHGSTSTP